MRGCKHTYLHSGRDPSQNGVLSVQPRRGAQRNKKLLFHRARSSSTQTTTRDMVNEYAEVKANNNKKWSKRGDQRQVRKKQVDLHQKAASTSQPGDHQGEGQTTVPPALLVGFSLSSRGDEGTPTRACGHYSRFFWYPTGANKNRARHKRNWEILKSAGFRGAWSLCPHVPGISLNTSYLYIASIKTASKQKQHAECIRTSHVRCHCTGATSERITCSRS